ncbi:MAG: hypothetical protein K2X47_15535, partial [Bdellovibrionales bacterium]|nr:hypothetical protein [Bdellovibrionales bacterium]
MKNLIFFVTIFSSGLVFADGKDCRIDSLDVREGGVIGVLECQNGGTIAFETPSQAITNTLVALKINARK